MIKSRSLAFGMLMLWGFVISVNIIFRHAHRLPNGRIISHVHPFKSTGEKGPSSSNPHTSSELYWLDAHSNNPFMGEFQAGFEFDAPIQYNDFLVEPYTFTFVSCDIAVQNPRGPPLLPA